MQAAILDLPGTPLELSQPARNWFPFSCNGSSEKTLFQWGVATVCDEAPGELMLTLRQLGFRGAGGGPAAALGAGLQR